MKRCCASVKRHTVCKSRILKTSVGDHWKRPLKRCRSRIRYFAATLILTTNKSNSPWLAWHTGLDIKKTDGEKNGKHNAGFTEKSRAQISFIFLPHPTSFYKATMERFYFIFFSKQSQAKSQLD